MRVNLVMLVNVDEFRKKLGRRIKIHRVELDLKQKELGDAVGVYQTQISEWETGRRMVKIEQAMDLARGLQTSVAYLVGESENRAS